MNIEITENNIIITNIELETIILDNSTLDRLDRLDRLEHIVQEDLYYYTKIEECNICFENKIISNFCKNKNCKNLICYCCYINIVNRNNNPLCPFCRYEYFENKYSESKIIDNTNIMNNIENRNNVNINYNNNNNNNLNDNLNNNNTINNELNFIVNLNYYNLICFKFYLLFLFILCIGLVILVQLRLI